VKIAAADEFYYEIIISLYNIENKKARVFKKKESNECNSLPNFCGFYDLFCQIT